MNKYYFKILKSLILPLQMFRIGLLAIIHVLFKQYPFFIIQTYKIIKNKTLDIKAIFKTYFKKLKTY